MFAKTVSSYCLKGEISKLPLFFPFFPSKFFFTFSLLLIPFSLAAHAAGSLALRPLAASSRPRAPRVGLPPSTLASLPPPAARSSRWPPSHTLPLRRRLPLPRWCSRGQAPSTLMRRRACNTLISQSTKNNLNGMIGQRVT
jgi:hypothetical protein